MLLQICAYYVFSVKKTQFMVDQCNFLNLDCSYFQFLDREVLNIGLNHVKNRPTSKIEGGGVTHLHFWGHDYYWRSLILIYM